VWWSLQLLLTAGCAGAEPGALSFLVISMDTFRADRVGALDANGRSLTPNLDALAAGSRVYTHAFSQSNETLFSHTALFTGRYPSEFGPLDYSSYTLPPDTETFAALLSRAGWATEAVVAGGHLSPLFGVNAGFQRYQSMTDFGSFQETVPTAAARLEELAAGDRPFLLFVHGYDAHSPYIKPGPLYRLDAPGYDGPLLDAARNPLTYERILWDRYFPGFTPPQLTTPDGRAFLDPSLFSDLAGFAERVPGEQLGEADVAFLRGAYDAAVRHVDFFVGVMLAELERSGAADRTAVFVLADHGEDLLDHGYFNHRLSLHDENVAVPLMVRIPGGEPARIDAPVALADVAPTLAGLAGLAPPEGRGRDLLGPADPARLVFSESLRGDVAMAGAAGRLSAPRAAAAALGARPPEGAWIEGPDGEPLDWSSPARATLAAALAAELRSAGIEEVSPADAGGGDAAPGDTP
jgi:arylsulfatase A-like enzyme